MRYLFLCLTCLIFLSWGCQNGQSSNQGDNNNQEKEEPTASDESSQADQSASNGNSKEANQELIDKAKQENPGKTGDSLNFIVQGVIDGASRSEVILDKLGIGTDVSPLATSVVNEEGRFRFGGKIPRPGLYQIRFPSESIHVVLTGGILHIEADFDNMNDYQLEGDGAKDTRYIKRMYDVMNRYRQMGDSLKQAIENTKNSGKRIKLRKKLDKVNEQKQKKKFRDLKSLIQEASKDTSIAAPIIAVRAQLFRDLDFFKDLANQYKDVYPQSTFLKGLEEKIRKTEEYLNNNPEAREKYSN